MDPSFFGPPKSTKALCCLTGSFNSTIQNCSCDLHLYLPHQQILRWFNSLGLTVATLSLGRRDIELRLCFCFVRISQTDLAYPQFSTISTRRFLALTKLHRYAATGCDHLHLGKIKLSSNASLIKERGNITRHAFR